MAFASLTIDLNARLANIEQDMGRVAHMMETRAKSIGDAWGKAIGVIGGLVGSVGFTAFIKDSIDAADNLNDLSKKTGVAVENLTGLQLVVDKSGTTMEMLGNGIGKLNKTLGEAANGNTEAARTLADLGISATDPMEAFFQLADAFTRFGSEGDKAVAMSRIIGKTWQELAPALAEGGAGLRAMVEEGQRLNPITQEMASQADKFNDALSKFKAEAKGVGTSIANDLLPFMNGMLERWNDALRLSREHGGFISLILGGTNPTGSNSDNLRAVNDEIEAIRLQMKDAGTVQGDIAGLDGDRLRARLAELEAIKKSLLEIQQRQALALNDQFGTGNYKQPTVALPKIVLSDGQKTELEKAFDIGPMDKYLEKFRLNARQIKDEFTQLKIELSGDTAVGAAPTGLDVTTSLMRARAAMQAGDATSASAFSDKAREELRAGVQSGSIGFESGYYADQLQAFALEMNDRAKEVATQIRNTARIELEQAGKDMLKLNLDPKEAVEQAREQARMIIRAAQEEFDARPLEYVIKPPSGPASASIEWSSDLSRTAAKLGGR